MRSDLHCVRYAGVGSASRNCFLCTLASEHLEAGKAPCHQLVTRHSPGHVAWTIKTFKVFNRNNETKRTLAMTTDFVPGFRSLGEV
jgi:hypothetical protein